MVGILLDKQCLCCRRKRFQLFGRGLIKCKYCGYVTAYCFYSDEELKELYQRDYFKGREYRDYIDSESLYRRNFKRRIREMLRFLPVGSRVWEIGCAYGFFLVEASQFYDVEGIDVAVEAVEYAKQVGVKAYCDDFLKLAIKESYYDAVCMWDTIEHLRNPEEFLRKVYSILKPGGVLFLTTGDITALVAQIQKTHWRLIHPPTHLHHFSRLGIKLILSSADFEVKSIRSICFWQSIENICHGLQHFGHVGETNKILRALTRILPNWIKHIYLPINLGDIIMVVAEKRISVGREHR